MLGRVTEALSGSRCPDVSDETDILELVEAISLVTIELEEA